MEVQVKMTGWRSLPAPEFQLPSNQGGLTSLRSHRGRCNLVVFFASPSQNPADNGQLAEFAGRYADYQAQEAKFLVVWPTMVEDLSPDHRYPFPVLADAGGRTRQAYADLLADPPGDAELLFVLDRYGAPFAALTGEHLGDPDCQQEILDWLGFINIQCPECGAIEWPANTWQE